MSHWKYKGKSFEVVPDEFFGFVYLITNTISNRKYIGRKYFGTTRRVKVKGKTRRKVIRKESDWRSYVGSSKSVLADVLSIGISNFKFEILFLGETKGQVNYMEENLQHKANVMIRTDYYNDCVGSRKFVSVKFTDNSKKLIMETKPPK
jgi:hypothetical protein|tara:strand:- start:3534 stop:3980 length:447 start_codon:yes stop_codon:yes gene_type:complete